MEFSPLADFDPELLQLLPQVVLYLMAVVMAKVNYLNHFDLSFFFDNL